MISNFTPIGTVHPIFGVILALVLIGTLLLDMNSKKPIFEDRRDYLAVIIMLLVLCLITIALTIYHVVF